MSTPSNYVPFGRRVIVVDRTFQLRYSLQLALAGGGISLLCAGMLYALLRMRERGLGLPPELADRLAAHDGAVVGMIFAMSALMAVLMGVAGVLVTHRIAGPVYTLSRYLAALAEGHYPKFRPLRKNDELRELFEILQAAVEFQRAREVQESFRLREALVALGPQLTSAEGRQVLASLQQLYEEKRGAAERTEAAPPAPVAAPTTSAA